MNEVSKVNNCKDLKRGMLKIDDLNLSLHRTVRVDPNANISELPPSLGNFEIFKVKDFLEKCPETWDENGYFIAMHKVEAMWMNFDCWGHPVALLIGAGGINAIDGEKFEENELKEDNYIVTPPQPWLDGFKGSDGAVYQFVATQYKDGEGKSVGEQMLKNESYHGGIQISIFEPNELWKNKMKSRQNVNSFGTSKFLSSESVPGMGNLYSLEASDMDIECSAAFMGTNVMQEMGMGKGGKIEQKIYKDSHGIEAWEKEPKHKIHIYFANGPMFSSITGLSIPELPPDFNSYEGLWFNLQDNNLEDTKGTNNFDKLEKTI